MIDAQSQSGRDASHLNCPRCGLSFEPRTHWLTVKYCPRCLARAHAVVEMFSSQLPARALYAADSFPADNNAA
jgi:hypothetical protein